MKNLKNAIFEVGLSGENVSKTRLGQSPNGSFHVFALWFDHFCQVFVHCGVESVCPHRLVNGLGISKHGARPRVLWVGIKVAAEHEHELNIESNRSAICEA